MGFLWYIILGAVIGVLARVIHPGKENMGWFRSLNLTEDDLERKGMHPVLGEVTLRNLLATWVAHDLGHLAQVVRVMARQYSDAVGPWRTYLSILGSR